MASIRKELSLRAPAERVWAALRDVGNIQQRLARGFVTDTRLEAGARVVTFASGHVVRELLVDICDEQRRVAYAVVGGAATHHNASMQVRDDGAGQCSLIWITDLLPDAAAAAFRPLIEAGAAAMQRTLEAQGSSPTTM